MSSYGDYQVIKEIGWSNGATLYSARKGNEENFAVKVFSLAFFGFAGDDDAKAAKFANLFNSRIENQKKAAGQSPRFAPIFQHGFDTDSAWYVTRLYSNSVQKLIESHAQLKGEEFFQLISSIVAATVEFKKICGRSHGNVKATNVFLTKPGQTNLSEIVLGDSDPGDESKAAECELADMRGIGEIIHRLVINENREEEYWRLPPPPTLQEWVGIFGKDAEAWRSLCERLLAPDLTIHNYNLDDLSFDIARLKPQPKFSQKQVFAMAAVVLLLGIAAAFGIKHFGGGRVDNAEAELRQKKIEEQAARLAKEKRAAEERANAEAKARTEVQRKAEAEAQRLAKEKQAAEERALSESRAKEEARRQAEIAERAHREAAEKVAEDERLLREARNKELKRTSEPQNPTVSTTSQPVTSVRAKPTGRSVWSNSLGMRFVPVTGSKILLCAWETRRKDYEQFVKTSVYHANTSWRSITFKQGDSEPVVNVDGVDAAQFCKWLTDYERKQGVISSQQFYRLPTDAEWTAVAIPDGNGGSRRPFTWGTALPAPVGAGNFAQWCSYDRFAFTAPVAQFQPNELGLFDIAGNVWELCENGATFVARGASWQTELPEQLSLAFRLPLPTGERRADVGFRCVLDLGN